MAARPPDRILDDILQKKGRGAAFHRKLVKNQHRNWLLAIMLHSFGKFADGKRLTDLEQSLVDAFKQHSYSDEQIKQHGRLGRRLPQQLRAEVFSGGFAQLERDAAYTFENLRQDADDITKTVLAAPNVTKIDVEAIHAGRATLKDYPRPSRSVLRDHGAAMLIATEPNVAAATSSQRYTIKATSFRCNDRAQDSITDPKNEPYLIFGSLGNNVAVTTRTKVFEDVDTGTTRSLAANEGCIWGQNCAPQALPDGEIGTLISLWEHDWGNVDEIKAGVAAAFAATAGILAATGVAAWVGAVVAGVGAMVTWLLGFGDDDFIADQTVVFTRQVVESQTTKAGQSFDVTHRLTDGDGDYTLTTKVTRVV